MIPIWKPSAAATLIGSMPHRDRQHAIDLILRDIGEVPVWPQLSRFESERMMVQYLEGLPGVREDDGHIVVATDAAEFDTELLEFYQDYMDVEAGTLDVTASRFRLGEVTGTTFYQFVQALESSAPAARAVKGQVTGPFTLLSGLTDRQRKPLIYDDRMPDAVAKHLALKARWQVEKLRTLGQPVIIFLDEPALAGYGSSAYIGVSSELVATLLDEVITGVHQAGALAGIHVCANTDWTLVLGSRADIVNFDAYGYLDRFLLYRDAVTDFLVKGRIIAWGLVPTSDPQAIQNETAESLTARWLDQIQPLLGPALSMGQILTQSLFTPSCGCGSLTEDLAERVVKLTREVSAIMKQRLAALG